MRNFDQWTEALTKNIYIETDEENAKVLWKMDEFFDDEIDEED